MMELSTKYIYSLDLQRLAELRDVRHLFALPTLPVDRFVAIRL